MDLFVLVKPQIFLEASPHKPDLENGLDFHLESFGGAKSCSANRWLVAEPRDLWRLTLIYPSDRSHYLRVWESETIQYMMRFYLEKLN
jgi:hypothetical protein